MVKKRGVNRVRSNRGYSKASPSFKNIIKTSQSIDTSWMDSLPGGTWEDPGVLHAYMRSKFDAS